MSSQTKTFSAATYPLLALIVLLGMSGLFWHNALLETPVYASDEYAYFVQGKFFHSREIVLQNDPGLQRIPNILYFRIVNAAFLGTADSWQTLRAMNVSLYCLCGLVFATVVCYIASRGAACWFLAFYFFLAGTVPIEDQ